MKNNIYRSLLYWITITTSIIVSSYAQGYIRKDISNGFAAYVAQQEEVLDVLYNHASQEHNAPNRIKAEMFHSIMHLLLQHDIKVQREREMLIYNFFNNLNNTIPNTSIPEIMPINNADQTPTVEKEIVIVTCSYNNKQWYKWNLDSIFSQQYTNYRLIYIDDCSTDDTYELVKAYVEQQKQSHRVTLIHNQERRRALANLYQAIHSCADNAIIIILDGDDRLAENLVLSYINRIYMDQNVWLTYGQFKEYPTGTIGFCKPMPDWIVKENAFRGYPDTPSHLRTFYAALFKHIQKEDLLYEGNFFPMTYDLAMMFPMIEMARNGHFKFIPHILLEYNAANTINDHKISKQLQRNCDLVIRGRKRYETLECLFNT